MELLAFTHPLAEGEVLLPHDVSDHALLPVPRAELVAELGPPRVPDEHLDVVVRVVVGCKGVGGGHKRVEQSERQRGRQGGRQREG